MNRRFVWIWGLVTAAIASVVGLLAYNAGQASHLATVTGADGRVIYPDFWGFGFFSFFGLFWFLLIGLFIFRLLFWRPWRGPRGYGGGYWHQHPHEHGDATSAPSTGQTDQRAGA